MRLFCITLCLLFGLLNNSFAQVFTDSNLPIVIINTYSGGSIPDYQRGFARMKILLQGKGNRTFITYKNNPGNFLLLRHEDESKQPAFRRLDWNPIIWQNAHSEL